VRLGRQPAFDGLRGAAWVVVFVAHANLVRHWAMGQVAMFVFFALSGFLITSLLIDERRATGHVSLRKFFARRTLRLLPALVFFLACWLAVDLLLGHEPWMSTVPGGGAGAGVAFSVALQGVGAALAYGTNWADVTHLFSGYVPLGHLWSLAVEEQFYLLWAPAVVLVLAWRRRAMGWAAAALAVASLLDVVVLRHAHGLTPWVDMGTDTRAGAFLAGAAVAAAWNRRSWMVAFLRRQARLPLALAVAACLGWAAWVFDHSGAGWRFASAWIGVSVGAAAMILLLVDGPESVRRHRVLSHPVLVYLGQRSYALYLWHYVWLTWLRGLGLPGVAGALLASLACAELSWRLVETPALARKQRFTPVVPTAPAAEAEAPRELVSGALGR